MPERPGSSRLVIRLTELPQIRLLIVELEVLVLEMEPGPARVRLERALARLRANLPG